jgi:hypothetical protein
MLGTNITPSQLFCSKTSQGTIFNESSSMPTEVLTKIVNLFRPVLFHLLDDAETIDESARIFVRSYRG